MRETIVGLVTSYGYLVVFLVVGLESLGIPLPGETALVTAAAFAAQGHLSVVGVVLAAIAGAFLGDNGGYWIGREGGLALARRHGRVLHLDEKKLDRVHAFFEKHGAKTVFIGRFIALLRTWAAFFAGAGCMPYREFLVWNALGGVTWAVIFGTLGYVFGRNLPTLERYVGQASLALVLLAALVAVIVVLWRRFDLSGAVVWGWGERAWQRCCNLGALQWLHRRYPRAWAFVVARFTPGEFLGLHLTVGLLLSVGALWVFGAVTEDVVHHDPLTLFDVTVARWLRAHATPSGDRFFYAVTVIGMPLPLGVLGAGVAGVLAWRRRWLAFWGWVAAFGGGSLLDWMLKHVVHRPRPPYADAYYRATGFSFPSGHAMMSLVAFGMLAYLLIAFSVRAARVRITVAVTALTLIMLIGFSRLYLGVHYFSDVVGGYAAGTVWVATCASGVEIARRRRAVARAVSAPLLPTVATLVLLLCGVLARPVGAQTGAPSCAAETSHVTLERFTGRPIRSVTVVTHDPAGWRGPARVLNGVRALHARTRRRTVARELLFAPGDSLDTLRVAESLRNLRRLPFLDDAAVTGRACPSGTDGASGVDVTVTTHDAWSTRPELKVGAGAAVRLGLQERNLLGTGQSLSGYVAREGGRTGLGVSLLDPWTLGARVSAGVSVARYANGTEWRSTVARRVETALDPWRVGFDVSQSVRRPRLVAPDTGLASSPTLAVALPAPANVMPDRRTAAALLVGRRVSSARAPAALFVLAGAEAERARLTAPLGADLVGPAAVARTFIAPDVGVVREAVRYDTLTWLLPGGTVVDVPAALEGDAVVGVGRDTRSGSTLTHTDAWAGRVWRPAGRTLLTTDVWASGHAGDDRWSAATVRAAAALYRAAPHGLWTVRLASENLVDPDPDVRALAADDPTLGALPARSRLAEFALAGSVERARYLAHVTPSYVVAAAAFGGGSYREDPAVRYHGDETFALVGGLGLRLVPTRPGRATARLDLGVPTVHSAGTRGRPFVALSVAPWFTSDRRRDGRVGW